MPADRNPFTYYRRVIISMDTLKQERFRHDLRTHRWDAVVIDESHNVTSSGTQNNDLATLLAPTTEALVLASATPHNGRRESFAQLLRLLEPTSVDPTGEVDDADLARLVCRRHRNSPEVAAVVGSAWAPRGPVDNRLVEASPAENALARELDEVWLHPESGMSPDATSGSGARLFGWTLAKAFLSSPAALRTTIDNRLSSASGAPLARRGEVAALERLAELNDATFTQSSKFDALVDHLRRIGISRTGSQRAVVFSERIDTVAWLRQRLVGALGLRPQQVEVLHGGMADVDLQQVIESFKQSSSPIRVLLTSDIASEGVNLHSQCHQLVHYDIPWSLIRIEQRNGRIDRYGQHVSPQITTLLLRPDSERFSGDLRVLTRLVEREEEAHRSLGDAASLMGDYTVSAEEAKIEQVLSGRRGFDEVVARPEALDPSTSMAARLEQVMARARQRAAGTQFPQGHASQEPLSQDHGRQGSGTGPTPAPGSAREAGKSPLYASEIDFLRDAMAAQFANPAEPPGPDGSGGVSWREHRDEDLVELVPPPDLVRRLDVLPESYLSGRRVTSKLLLATTPGRAAEFHRQALDDSSSTTSWPQAHFLGPLHPVLDWASDRALAALSRNAIFAVEGTVDAATVLVLGTLTNRRGQVVTATWSAVQFPSVPADPQPGEALSTGFDFISQHPDAASLLRSVGLSQSSTNTGTLTEVERFQPLVAAAVDAVTESLAATADAVGRSVEAQVNRWNERTKVWTDKADALVQSHTTVTRRRSVEEEDRIIKQMSPDRQLVRPLLLVVPSRSSDR